MDFCIYNYAEFYTAVTKYTDADGRTFSSAGQGDMLIWASKDGAYGYARASFGKETEVKIVLDSPFGSESFTIVPPPENVQLPEVSPQLRALNDQRFAREDSLRHAYEATFRTDNPILRKARGNWQTLEHFLSGDTNPERREKILASLSNKDFHDITPQLLQDYSAAGEFLGARVENEFLTPFYGYFADIALPAEPEGLVRWVRENIGLQDDPKAWRIPMSPRGVYESRMADPRSRDIFFVSAARAKGIEARKDPVTGKVQYKAGEEWLDVHFDGAQEAVVSPKGILKLSYTPTPTIANPQYYTHFSISKLEGGRLRLMAFDEGEVDMGGGVDWAHVFRDGFRMDAGQYLLVSGNRTSSGSVPVSMLFFSIPADGTAEVPLRIDEGSGAVPVMGSLDAETLFTPDGADAASSLLAAAGRGFYAVAILEPGKEPTNHALRDLAAARERLEAWGRPIVLLCESPEALTQLKKESAEGRYGKLPSTVLLGLDTSGVRAAIAVDQKLAGTGRLPLVVVADTFNRLFFCSEGYTIGLGDQIAGIVTRL